MITLDEFSGKNQERFVRETVAPFVIVEDGEQRTEQIRVQYYSLSIAQGKQYRSSVAATGDAYWSDLLFPLLAGLPDLVDAKKKPVKITRELLEKVNGQNLRAIYEAIQADLSTKKNATK